MVDEGNTGMKFRYADLDDLRRVVSYMIEHPEASKTMGENAYRLIETKYSPESHYNKLIGLMNKVVGK